MADLKWKPIAPLSDRDRKIDLSALRPIHAAWREASARERAGNPERLREIVRRLTRRMIVEIGILENLYRLDRSTAEALVDRGFDLERVQPSSASIDPKSIVDALKNQEAAIDFVADAVRDQRPLTTAMIHEIQTIQMRHQDTATDTDAAGNKHVIPLVKGRFKEVSNDSRKPDGSIQEFCPPDRVDGEIDNLLRWLGEYDAENPLLVATWLFYHLYQMHPYHHGNGRVVRAVVMHKLLRADLLPLAIDRDDLAEYKGGIASADAGDLGPLASFFMRLQQQAMI